MVKCLFCGNETSNPKFCGRSCAASYNNKKFLNENQNISVLIVGNL